MGQEWTEETILRNDSGLPAETYYSLARLCQFGGSYSSINIAVRIRMEYFHCGKKPAQNDGPHKTREK
ncbi:MAG: hypothetical protein NPIRA06_25280 [Nitrospirales bacterium]|nr:MAG: hypothetical protein NPIRA06_25280 [Nitrospirales bacterium]